MHDAGNHAARILNVGRIPVLPRPASCSNPVIVLYVRRSWTRSLQESDNLHVPPSSAHEEEHH
jgi:hypothetical protein